MSNTPFRDDRAAVHHRVEQLEKQNEELRRQLAHARGASPRPRLWRVLWVTATAVLVCATAVGFAALRRADHRPSRGMRLRVSTTPVVMGVSGTIRAVAETDGDVYAVGDDGLILHREPNGEWMRQPSETHATLRAITAAPGHPVAVGDRGTVVQFDFRTRSWRLQPTPTDADLYAASYGIGGPVVAGANGTILRRLDPYGCDGAPHRPAPWAAEASGTRATIRALSPRLDNDTMYAVGDHGTVLQYFPYAIAEPGQRWIVQASNTTEDLRAVAASGTDIVVVGAHGTVLRTRASGRTPWMVESVGGADGLNGLAQTRISYVFHQGNINENASREMLVAVGEQGSMFAYFDALGGGPVGPGWYRLPSATTRTLLGTTPVGKSLITVGESGAVLMSAPSP